MKSLLGLICVLCLVGYSVSVTCTIDSGCMSSALSTQNYCCRNSTCYFTTTSCAPLSCTSDTACKLLGGSSTSPYCCRSGGCKYSSYECQKTSCTTSTDCAYGGASTYCCQSNVCIYSSLVCGSININNMLKTYDDNAKTLADIVLAIALIFFGIVALIMVLLIWRLCRAPTTSVINNTTGMVTMQPVYPNQGYNPAPMQTQGYGQSYPQVQAQAYPQPQPHLQPKA